MIFLWNILIALSFTNTLDLSALDDSVTKNLVTNHKNLLAPPISKEKVDQILRLIYKTNKFYTVRATVESNNNTKIYKIITETIPSIKKVIFDGDLEFSESTLATIAQIGADENYDPYKVRAAVDRLKEHYRKNAYLSVEINTQLDFAKEGRVIRFFIEANEPSKIKDIRFNVNNPELKKGLASFSKSYRKDLFTEENVLELQNEIREYLLDKKFYSARVSDPNFEFLEKSSQVNISYKITEDFKYNIHFDGNYKISSSRLMNALNFENGEPLGINPAADIRERLREFYKNQAFANIDIETDQTYDKEKMTYKISVHIKEGKEVMVKSFTFDGAASFSPNYYTNFIKSNSGPLLEKGKFNAEELELGLSNLVTHLQNQGFLMARILTARTTFADDRSQVEIYIRLEEGPLSILTEVNFKGAEHFAKSELLNVIGLDEGKALQLKKIENSIDKLTEFYKENGYLEVSIDPNSRNFIQYSDNNTKAVLNYNISEGHQIIVNNIVVSGNSMTKDYVILKSLDFKENDILTLEKVRESESKLKRLGLFSSIAIAILPSNSPRRVVTVSVSERYPGTLTFGVGVSNELELTFRGYTGLAYRNLFGTARAVQGRLQLKSNIRVTDFLDYSANASYLEPFLFGSNTKGKINLVNSQQLTSESVTNLDAIKTTALSLMVERDINRFLKLHWKVWGIEINEKFKVDEDGNKSNEEERRIAEIGPTVELDFRDNPFVPKTGTYTRWNLDYSDPDIGSTGIESPGDKEINYLKTSLQFNHYMPFFNYKNITFAYSLRGGYLKNLGKKGMSAVPEEKMFFLGGLSTIRGFETNTIPDERLLIAPGDSFASLTTESHYYLIKTEIRVPIYENFGTAFFYDGGGVKVRGKDLGDEYRDSVGLSLQLLTPIGAINLGYGYKLDRDFSKDESEGEIFFSIGDF